MRTKAGVLSQESNVEQKQRELALVVKALRDISRVSAGAVVS